ncbi:hypothetical protein Taro_046704 [Colocasia esculenta]|uniref:Uncharacterized protein n=1 Tax=Colocasia esculenta TaxID=4460 RepID=A0A843WUE9_COLES|nr:hypothetical protein [Colocasia esculenta]
MAIGEEFLYALRMLLDKLASRSISELCNLSGVEGDIARLRKALESLQAMLHDAEEKNVVRGHKGTLWLQEIKTVLYAAEDVVGEFEYEGGRLTVKNSAEESDGGGGGGSSTLSESRSSLIPEEVSFHCKVVQEIDSILISVDRIEEWRKFLDFVGMRPGVKTNPSEFQGRIETSVFLGDLQVFGRDEEEKELMQLLLTTTIDVGSTPSPSLPVHPTNFSVISVVGMGGLGKTTLAQLVCNAERVQDHFPAIIWVFVSPNFDPKRLTKQVLEHLSSVVPNIDDLHVLQHNLSEKLKGKRFLLILDGIWEVDQSKWKEFSAPLLAGAKDSKVLITTRNANVTNPGSRWQICDP